LQLNSISFLKPTEGPEDVVPHGNWLSQSEGNWPKKDQQGEAKFYLFHPTGPKDTFSFKEDVIDWNSAITNPELYLRVSIVY